MDPTEFNDSTDPFDTLSLPARFDLARADIERAYLSKTAQSHPDLAESDEADSDAETQSAALNRARARLLDPEARATALLTRHGGPAASDDRSLPNGFLADIMTSRLEIEEAIASADPEAIARWRTWATQQRTSYTEQTADAFAALADPTDQHALAAIRQTLNAWRYIERLLEQLPAHAS